MSDDRAEKPNNHPGSGRTGGEIDHEGSPAHSRPPPEKQIERSSRGSEVHALFNARECPVQEFGSHVGCEICALMTAPADGEHHIDTIAIAPATYRPCGQLLVVAGAEGFDLDRRIAGPQVANGFGHGRQRQEAVIAES